jgi:hypothetical protein
MSTTSLGHVKKVQDDSFLSQCCRGSGQFMAPAQDCKPPSMPSFEPRAFPPPSLSNVPIEYIVGQLHNFAAQYWDKPETADCTISTSFHHLFLHSIFLTSFQSFLFPMLNQYLNCLHCRQSPFSSLRIRLALAMVTKPL